MWVFEGRRRKALAEIRRKAKVYTPIRAELVSLQRAIGEGRHAGYRGILRERPEYQTMVPAPVLVIWREFVEDGRANTTASARVTAALDGVDAAADSLNDPMTVARGTFKERGEAIAEQSGFSPAVTNWYESEFQALIRHGLRSSGAFSNPFADGPGAEPPHTLTGPRRVLEAVGSRRRRARRYRGIGRCGEGAERRDPSGDRGAGRRDEAHRGQVRARARLMRDYGFSENEARRFLEKELRRHDASTSFYWESEESEEVVDLLVEVFAKLVEANNKKMARDWANNGAKDLKPPRT